LITGPDKRQPASQLAMRQGPDTLWGIIAAKRLPGRAVRDLEIGQRPI